MYIEWVIFCALLSGMKCNYGNYSCDTNAKIPKAHFQVCKGSHVIKHGSILPVYCIDEYEPRDSTTVAVTCNNGSWIGVPKCVPKCSPFNLTEGMFALYLKKLYFVGESLIVVCRTGYFTIGAFPTTHIQVTCINSETWSLQNLECVATDSFAEVDKPQTEDHVFVHGSHHVVLPCSLSKNKDLSNYTLIWIRNQHDITSRTLYSTSHYVVDYDGSLKITKFRPHMEGLYLCFARNANHMVLGDIYRVKRGHKCRNLQHTPTRTIQQLAGTPLLLMCPKYKPSKLVPVWHKDGHRIWNSERLFLFTTGLMAIKSLHTSDSGTYTCSYYDEKTGCSKAFNMIVNAFVVSHDCGNSDLGLSTWTVSLWWNNGKFPLCYGVLIKRHWILTAAKCFLYKNLNKSAITNQLKIRIARSKNHATYDIFQAKSVEIHPNYSSGSNFADLALVQLKVGERDALPVCFIEGMNELGLRIQPNITGFVDGWGPLYKSTLTPNLIRTATQTSSINNCLYDPCNIPKFLFCAKSIIRNGSQSGDIGSPFSVILNGQHFLMGVYSWSAIIDDMGQFDYFTDISAFESWILHHTGESKSEK